MSNISLMYKLGGIASAALKGALFSTVGGTALINAAMAYKDYKENLYQLTSGMPPEAAEKVSLLQKLVRTPPKPGSKIFINFQKA